MIVDLPVVRGSHGVHRGTISAARLPRNQTRAVYAAGWRAATWRAATWRARTWRATTWRAPTWRAPTWPAPTPAGTSTTWPARSTGCSTAPRTSGPRRPPSASVMGIGSTAFAKLLGQQSRQRQDLGGPGQAALGLRHSSGGPLTLQRLGGGGLGRQDLLRVRDGRPAERHLAGRGRLHQGGLPLERAAHPDHGDQRHRGQRAPRPDPEHRDHHLHRHDERRRQAPRRHHHCDRPSWPASWPSSAPPPTTSRCMVDFSSWVQDKNKNAAGAGQRAPPAQPPHLRRGALHRPRQRRRHRADHPRRRRLPRQDHARRHDQQRGGPRTPPTWPGSTGSGPSRCPAVAAARSTSTPGSASRCRPASATTASPGLPVSASRAPPPGPRVAGTTAPDERLHAADHQRAARYKRALHRRQQLRHDEDGPQPRPTCTCGSGTTTSRSAVPARRRATPPSARAGARTAARSAGPTTAATAAPSPTAASCGSPQTCGGGGVANVCGSSDSTIYEAEALGQHLQRLGLRSRLRGGVRQGARQQRPRRHRGGLRRRRPAAVRGRIHLEPRHHQEGQGPHHRDLHPHHLRHHPGHPHLLPQRQRWLLFHGEHGRAGLQHAGVGHQEHHPQRPARTPSSSSTTPPRPPTWIASRSPGRGSSCVAGGERHLLLAAGPQLRLGHRQRQLRRLPHRLQLRQLRLAPDLRRRRRAQRLRRRRLRHLRRRPTRRGSASPTRPAGGLERRPQLDLRQRQLHELRDHRRLRARRHHLPLRRGLD